MASKILIVEDEPDIVELLVYNLHQAGFETEAVFNGADALEQVKIQQPDLVLLDLLLPEVDGLEICRALKRDSETVGIPIIMLTAKGEAIDRIVGLELGADDYYNGPQYSGQELSKKYRLTAPCKRRPENVNQTDTSHCEIQVSNCR